MQPPSNEQFAELVTSMAPTDPDWQFKPFAQFNPDGDEIEFILSNDSYYGREVRPGLVAHHSQETDELIGFTINFICGGGANLPYLPEDGTADVRLCNFEVHLRREFESLLADFAARHLRLWLEEGKRMQPDKRVIALREAIESEIARLESKIAQLRKAVRELTFPGDLEPLPLPLPPVIKTVRAKFNPVGRIEPMPVYDLDD